MEALNVFYYCTYEGEPWGRGRGRLPGVCECPPVTVPVPIPIPRGRGSGRHRRRDAAQGSGGHHQQLRADALPAPQGSSDSQPQNQPLFGGSPPPDGWPAPQEPHPARLSAESAARRLARLDTRSPNVFENLDQLKSFFVEVRTPPGVLGRAGVVGRAPSSCCVPTGHQ